MSAKCRICSADTSHHGTSLVLGKYEARYLVCPECGFVSVADPHWLAEAYQSAIAEEDLGSLWRAVRYSKAVKSLINLGGFDRGGRFLDFGGGFGLFVRQMRDLGYDFRYHDAHCENLFARGFDANLERDAPFEIITAFEVFEHLVDPLATIERLASMTLSIVFSTAVISTPPPKLGDWWYYLPSTGQHISFYSHRSLAIIGKRLGLRSYSRGKEIHMLSSKNIPEPLFNMVSNPRLAKWIDLITPRPSLLEKDVERALKMERRPEG
jgi:hypothetical protein